MAEVKKAVLAYSGGLDTSVILKWLGDTYGCEVVTFTADIGQGEELDSVRPKAQALGVKEIFVDDLREEFVRDFVYPMFRANAIYEGEYLLGKHVTAGEIQTDETDETDGVLLVALLNARPMLRTDTVQLAGRRLVRRHHHSA